MVKVAKRIKAVELVKGDVLLHTTEIDGRGPITDVYQAMPQDRPGAMMATIRGLVYAVPLDGEVLVEREIEPYYVTEFAPMRPQEACAVGTKDCADQHTGSRDWCMALAGALNAGATDEQALHIASQVCADAEANGVMCAGFTR